MEHTTLEPIGVEVTGVALDRLTPDEVETLKVLLADHGVLVARDQHLDDERFLTFLRSFGELAFTKGEAAADGFPDLNVVTNVGRATPPRSSYHVDTSYVATPPAYTALRAVEIPTEGGETLFTNQLRAYETLPAELRADLEGRTVRHAMTGLDLDPDDETEADHPLFRPHPITGRVALYLSTPQRCVAVSGMDDDEAAATIAGLLTHSTREENVHRHAWQPGDVVMWDNAVVLHKADHSGVVGDRTMHRGMVAGRATA